MGGMSVQIITGECREVLAGMSEASVQTCVTSPPYFGLRDYGVEGQIGLEASPDAYVAEMVAVFREVRRVLRDDGTLWLNLGDSYAADRGCQVSQTKGGPKHGPAQGVRGRSQRASEYGLKPKDRMMIPAQVALALRADGWWLRDEIVWSKPNPMPESVTDRTTKAHEMVYLLSKSGKSTIWRARDTDEWSSAPDHSQRLPRPTEKDPHATVSRWRGFDYFYDADAIAEPAAHPEGSGNRKPYHVEGQREGENANLGGSLHKIGSRETRNRRSVWPIVTQPFAEAHFATMPPALADLCIRAGSRPGDTVLDPFGGAGTTGLAADRLQRDAVLIELNPAYADLARKRINGEAPLFAAAAE